MPFYLKLFSLIMCAFLSVSGLFGSGSKQNFTYAEDEITEKAEKEMTEYRFGENDICVSVSGNDGSAGTEAEPVATLGRAKELAAEKRAAGAGHINVWIRPGEYHLSEKLDFTENDASDVSYIAAGGGKVTVSGDVKISGWKADSLNGHECLSAEIPRGASHTSVFKNGKTLPQTRYPETGYFTIEKEDHSGALYTAEDSPWSLTYGDLQFTPAGGQEIKDFRNPECVTVRFLHLWVDDFSKLTGYDGKNNRICFESPVSASIKEGDRYYFENVCEAFDSPGEWYAGNTRIYYIPLEGETADNLDISIAVTDRLISISRCNDIEFEGIEFRNTDSAFPQIEEGSWLSEYGMRFPQAEYDCGGVLEATDCSGINVRYCRFINIGIYGVKFNRLVKDSSVTGCDFINMGAGGVFIHGFNEEPEERRTERITVCDNLIDGYGRYFCSAIGVLLTHARDCDISNNEICNGYYTAISDGWLWGYTYNVTCNNRICNNLIYNIGQGWLSDMGGIYTLGRQKGTVLSGNVIYNVAADPGENGYGGWGIYLDEGSQYILVEKNLVYDCGSQSFHQHYGENNILRNNIFALSKEGQITSSFYHGDNQIGYEDEETHCEFTLERNIILTDDTGVYVKLDNRTFKDDTNLYWDLTNGKYVFADYYSSNQKDSRVFARALEKEYGLFNGAVIADPGFRDPANGDFTLPEDNGALDEIGFEKWDYSAAGTLTEHSR